MFKSHKIAMEDAWQGTVVDKKRNMPDGSNMYHYVEIKLSDGKTKKFRISGDLWSTLEVGDSLLKEAGADPVRV